MSRDHCLAHSSKIYISGYELGIIQVNTFLISKVSPTVVPAEVIRATETEKQYQIDMLTSLHSSSAQKVFEHIAILQNAAVKNENL